MKQASYLTRFLALTIDISIVSVFCAIAFFSAFAAYVGATGSFSMRVLVLATEIAALPVVVIYLFYFTYLNMRGGVTVGKRIFGIKVIRRNGMGVGMELGFFRAFVRSLAFLVSASLFGIGIIMSFFFRGSTLHDMIAGTQVVEEES